MALVLAAVLLVFGGGVGAIATTFREDGTTAKSGDTSPEPQPPVVATTSEEPSSSPSSTEPTTESSTEDTATEPSTDTSTTRASGFAEPVAALADNPVNIADNGATNTSCALPDFGTDTQQQNAFYEAALPCLMDAWSPALADADLPTDPPNVVTTDHNVDTPCGPRSWDQTAMYCGIDHTIYMTARYYSDVEGQTDPGVYLGQFAHEFGHAVQGMSGISGAYDDSLTKAGGYDTANGAELSRRSELQATCYGGMSLAALQNGGVSNDYIFPALTDAGRRGDERSNGERTHGTLANNEDWVERGFYTNRVAQCNTWTAADSAVS